MSKEIDLNESNINQIYLLYKEEFINCCENILIENQNDFLDRFYHKMDLIIKKDYGENIFDKIPSLYLAKKQCENKFITDIFWPMREFCLKAKNDISSHSQNIPKYLTNFRPHCLYDQVPLHTCGSKFIPVFDKNNKIIYVICSGCDKCYYSNFIAMNCHYCQIDFYSEVININNNLFSATWKNYHCNNDQLLINEQMHCIMCNNLLFIRNNKLYCQICKEYFDPEDFVWTCKVCGTEFKSDIKIYNPYEFKEIELIKQNAFLYKKISKPNYLPCNCISNNNFNNVNFFHEPDGKCKGVMYYCFINNKEFLICSECKKIYELNKFCWKCPICYKKYIINELKFEYANKDNNNFYKKIKNSEIFRKQNNISRKKIHNSCSQKIIATDTTNFIKNNKICKNKNNSYVKKRINSSLIKSNNSMNISSEKKYNKNSSILNKKKILLKNSNISNINNSNINNSSNREINSFQNKYNMASTAYSSFMNNNNIKVPQTERNATNSFISSKNDKIIIQNKCKINKYINKKIVNYSSTIINNNSSTNRKIYFKSKHQNIEKFINEFNFTDKSKNKNVESAIKSINAEKNNENNKEGFLKILKNGFKKYRKNNYKEKSFCINKINPDKSFISQKTDINQIYIPKKHIHTNRSSLELIPNSPSNKFNKINNIKYNHSCEKRRIINNDNNKSKFKINTDIKNLSKDKNSSNDNYLKDLINKKIKNRKRNYTNIYHTLTENNKGSSMSTIDVKKKKVKNNDISFKKYIKTNYNNKINNKNSKLRNEIINHMKLNLDNISNNNQHKGNKIENKKEYLTSYNNNSKIKNNMNKYKSKKENVDNKKTINKKIQTSKTKSGLTQRAHYRNSKRSGLTDIISNFNQMKNSINDKPNNSREKINNTQNIININENNNLNLTDDETKIPLKEDLKEKKILSESSPDDDELKTFNFEEYKIITQLGQGSFGKIYLVQNSKNELFTMKKLVYSEELDVQTVIKEYRMCYKLKHPNVVKILGIYNKQLDKTTYVVYVLMEVGLTDWEKEIKKHMEKNIYYTEKELIHIIKQLTHVLSFLQKSNVSHRDIKPQNILVFKNNIYKIADFGEAKQIENKTINLISNSLRGTELYMSPLLFNGLRTGQVDIRHNVFKSDVYSFGLCILFAASLQMITLYDIRKIVAMEELRKYLNKSLENKYSQKFIDLIGLLLEIHEQNRPDFIQLEEMMKEWKIDEK